MFLFFASANHHRNVPTPINKEDSTIAIDRKPAEGAEVFVELSHSIAHADADGYATLKGLCSTTTDVEINYRGKHHHLIFE